MGLFFRRKKKPIEEAGYKDGGTLELVYEKPMTRTSTIAGDSIMSPEGRRDIVQEYCEQITDAVRQVEEAKMEYEAVTAYLTDMQKIDAIAGEARIPVEDAARNIVTCTREREKLKRREIKLSMKQLQTIEKYEAIILKEYRAMEEKEKYRTVIEGDLRQLEAEKARLQRKQREIIGKQKYLKKVAVITSVLVVMLFALLFVFMEVFESNMSVPFILTILMAAVSGAYIFKESRNNHVDMDMAERMLKRAVMLLNKVKIKYVNTSSFLEYSYEKFGVMSSTELEYQWKQYLKIKEEERKMAQNKEKLRENNAALIEELKKYKVADPEVWIYQAIAILDSKEMVEIRHRLNIRRQKLRERMDYNNQVKADGLEQIRRLLVSRPEQKDEIERKLRQYHINVL